MTCKIICFCQDSNSVNSNYCRGCRGKKKSKTMLNGFNDQYIKNTCFVATIFWEPLIFANNNLFRHRDLHSSPHCNYNFFNSTFPLRR